MVVTDRLLKLEPRYSDGFRKKMNSPVGFYPISTPFVVSTTTAARAASPTFHLTSSNALSLSPMGRSQTQYSKSTTTLSNNVNAVDENEELRFNSLADLRWANFETFGFEDDIGGLNKRLALDINESARRVCSLSFCGLTGRLICIFE